MKLIILIIFVMYLTGCQTMAVMLGSVGQSLSNHAAQNKNAYQPTGCVTTGGSGLYTMNCN